MRLNTRTSRWQGLAPALSIGVLGVLLAACGGGGDLSLIPTPTAPTYGYTSGRPAAASTTVTSTTQLAAVIGIEGAGRVPGNIPAPGTPGLSSLNHSKNIIEGAVAAGRKIASRTIQPRIAYTATNYDAIQGSWLLFSDATSGSGYVVSGDVVVAVAESGGTCASATAFMDTPTFLTTLTSLSGDTAVLGGVTMTRDTGNVLAACDTSNAINAGGWFGTITSNVGQILFTDNSTFNYSFTSTTVPTAVFVKITGADDYFIVPASALQRSGDNYTIEFYGPTTSGTQIIASTLASEITVQVFYGDATAADLVDGMFTGSDVAANWSAPVHVPVATQAVATGVLQFNLTWNTLNDTDLHVIEPSTNEIYWAEPVSTSGGQLDVDNTYGYGPENIYWATTVPAGTYQVFVENFDGDAAPAYTLTVTKRGHSVTYTGSLPATAGAQSAPITVTVP